MSSFDHVRTTDKLTPEQVMCDIVRIVAERWGNAVRVERSNGVPIDSKDTRLAKFCIHFTAKKMAKWDAAFAVEMESAQHLTFRLPPSDWGVHASDETKHELARLYGGKVRSEISSHWREPRKGRKSFRHFYDNRYGFATESFWAEECRLLPAALTQR